MSEDAATGGETPAIRDGTYGGGHLVGAARVDRREVARDAGAASVALLALDVAVGLGRSAAALGLAAIDDHLHVGVVAVVLDQLVVELVGELLGHDAVDHARIGPDARRAGRPGATRPGRRRRRWAAARTARARRALCPAPRGARRRPRRRGPPRSGTS